MNLRSKDSAARLLLKVAAHGHVVLRLSLKTVGRLRDKGGEGLGGVNVTSSPPINITPCRQLVNDISRLEGNNKEWWGVTKMLFMCSKQ